MTESQLPTTKSEGKIDRWGAFASTACALHCAACAFIPATFAVLGVDFLTGHEAEWALTLVAVSLGLIALFLGWRRHGNMLVLITLSVGIVGLLAARGLESGGHHDEHEVAAASAEVKADGHAATAGTAQEHGSESHHEEGGHGVGGLLGIFSGLLLMLGHVFNLGQLRRERASTPECLPTS